VYLLEQKQYGLEMDAILTLKEFDAEMQQQERRQRKRMKRVQHQLRAEGWLQDAEQTAEPATTEEESVAAVGADASATEGNEA
jgi:hypothetical protein